MDELNPRKKRRSKSHRSRRRAQHIREKLPVLLVLFILIPVGAVVCYFLTVQLSGS